MNLLGIGPLELILIVAIALIVLGPAKLLSSARSIGKLFGEARSKVEEAKSAIEETIVETPDKPQDMPKGQLPSGDPSPPKGITH